MNKMLRLKDLFKIDFSSKGGGKLADKIFNKYNITKEEREEVKNEISSGGGGGDSIFTEAYIRFKKENYKNIAVAFAEVNLEAIIISDNGLKSIANVIILEYGVQSLPYGRFRFPINVLGCKINNLEDIKNMPSSNILFDEEVEEITADEFYNAFNS